MTGASPRSGIGCERTGWGRAGRPQKPGFPAQDESSRQFRRCCAAPARTSAQTWSAGGRRGGSGSSGGPAGVRRTTMFDSSQYPYNCFNYDADDYPAGSSDEEKRLTRPAYR